MSLVTLKAELRQELKLTPQLLQSMEILQMNSQELLEYLGKISEENPLVEQEDAPALRSAYEELRQKASWIDGGLRGGTFVHEDAGIPERGALDRETESLAAFLRDQLDRLRLPKPLLALTRYLAELVDGDGYLAQEDLDGLKQMKVPVSLLDQALETIQSLEPAGVGARSLSECLLLQLSRQESPAPAVMDIVARFLPELSRKHYGPIARELGLSTSEIQAAEKAIAALEPHPGRAFQPAEPTVYVRPDVFVVELDGRLQVVLNEYYLPRVTISDYYARLLKESDETGGPPLHRIPGGPGQVSPVPPGHLSPALFLQPRRGTDRALPAGGEAAPAGAGAEGGPAAPPQRPGARGTPCRGGHPPGPPDRCQIPGGAGHPLLRRPPTPGLRQPEALSNLREPFRVCDKMRLPVLRRLFPLC